MRGSFTSNNNDAQGMPKILQLMNNGGNGVGKINGIITKITFIIEH